MCSPGPRQWRSPTAQNPPATWPPSVARNTAAWRTYADEQRNASGLRSLRHLLGLGLTSRNITKIVQSYLYQIGGVKKKIAPGMGPLCAGAFHLKARPGGRPGMLTAA